jgi:hypothetical protein
MNPDGGGMTTQFVEALRCRGCDLGEYPESNPIWPCTTMTLIADHIEVKVNLGDS